MDFKSKIKSFGLSEKNQFSLSGGSNSRSNNTMPNSNSKSTSQPVYKNNRYVYYSTPGRDGLANITFPLEFSSSNNELKEKSNLVDPTPSNVFNIDCGINPEESISNLSKASMYHDRTRSADWANFTSDRHHNQKKRGDNNLLHSTAGTNIPKINLFLRPKLDDDNFDFSSQTIGQNPFEKSIENQKDYHLISDFGSNFKGHKGSFSLVENDILHEDWPLSQINDMQTNNRNSPISTNVPDKFESSICDLKRNLEYIDFDHLETTEKSLNQDINIPLVDLESHSLSSNHSDTVNGDVTVASSNRLSDSTIKNDQMASGFKMKRNKRISKKDRVGESRIIKESESVVLSCLWQSQDVVEYSIEKKAFLIGWYDLIPFIISVVALQIVSISKL
ncbi:hypothetical protein AYI68_g1428 [Smittium mucronatum]|uniref:Uncharacterized protein n=1 Tax=Smittium mucronatum TaxID=133383 RepID=A0A1R0H5P8_9FUNG|nr:hypothetical protein AYI68_g1428 [Smittium mucronatum]